VQGYRLVLQSLVFPFPVPLFATWQANNMGESTIAKQAIKQKPLLVTDVLLGDAHLWRRRTGEPLPKGRRLVINSATVVEKTPFFQTRFV